MEFWEENKKMLLGCACALGLLLILHLFLIGPTSRKVGKMTGENEEWGKKLSQYYPEGGTSVASLQRMFAASNGSLAGRLNALKEKMTLGKDEVFIVPEDEPQPGFYFRRLLTKKRNDLLFYAGNRGVESVDITLGFQENVPEDSEVPGMMKKLAAACELVMAAADSGVRAVENINHLKLSTSGPSGYAPFIEEHAVTMSIHCDIVALMKFVHNLGERKDFFSLRELKVESPGRGDEKLLEVEISCVAFSFFEPVEEPKTGGSGGPGGPAAPVAAPTYGM